MLCSLARRARQNAADWQVADGRQTDKITALQTDFDAIVARFDSVTADDAYPWDSLYRWSEDNLSPEGQEAVVSLLFEPYGALIDGLAGCMSADETTPHRIDGRMGCDAALAILERDYDWTDSIDFSGNGPQARVWYCLLYTSPSPRD
mgnify:FL=1